MQCYMECISNLVWDNPLTSEETERSMYFQNLLRTTTKTFPMLDACMATLAFIATSPRLYVKLSSPFDKIVAC